MGDPWFGVRVPEKQRHGLGRVECEVREGRTNEESAADPEGNSHHRGGSDSAKRGALCSGRAWGAGQEEKGGQGLRFSHRRAESGESRWRRDRLAGSPCHQ